MNILSTSRLVLVLMLFFQAVAAAALSPASSSALIAAARSQIGKTIYYDPAYVRLTYPGGDVPAERGVCTDVIIRAVRSALNRDLQQLVHLDIRRNFAAYPRHWGLKKPDRNIDHRRVPNLQVWFSRHEKSLKPVSDPKSYLPGDIVTCNLPGNLPHIMIVSDRMSADSIPLVIHNIGQGTREENVLFMFPHTGHYRFR